MSISPLAKTICKPVMDTNPVHTAAAGLWPNSEYALMFASARMMGVLYRNRRA